MWVVKKLNLWVNKIRVVKKKDKIMINFNTSLNAICNLLSSLQANYTEYR